MGLLDSVFTSKIATRSAELLGARVGAAANEMQALIGHATTRDGGQGHFVWAAGSSAQADGGLVLGSGPLGRWLRLSDGTYFNVRWFGAKGDGVTDDTAAIQSALTAVSAGGTLYFPEGTYLASTTLHRTANIHLLGYGATIKRSGTWNGILLYVHGTSKVSRIGYVTVEGLTFDGNDQGTISYTPLTPSYDLDIVYVERVSVTDCTFQNTKLDGLTVRYCGFVSVYSSKFRNGAFSSQADSAHSVYHSSIYNCERVIVDGNYYTWDGEFEPGDGTHGGETSFSPFAVALYHNDYVQLTNNVSIDAGNFEVYEGNREVVISDNIFLRCQVPPIKLSNCQHYTITGNQCLDTLCQWGSGIYVGSYTRLFTYGTIRPEQGVGTIVGNTVRNNRTKEGAIFVVGEQYSTSLLDARIASQGSYGYTTQNIVYKDGSDYYYVDYALDVVGATNATPIVVTTHKAHDYETGQTARISGVLGNTAANGDWTVTRLTATTFSLDTSSGNGAYSSGGASSAIHGPIDQEYLNARGTVVADNTVDGFCVAAIKSQYTENLTITGNTITNAANDPTPQGWLDTKACVVSVAFKNLTITNNSFAMPRDAVPNINGTPVGVTGVFAWSTETGFARASRLVVDGNRFDLTQVASLIDFQDCAYVSVQRNDFRVQDFLTASSAFVRGRGINTWGKIAGNNYELGDTSITPSASTEYTAIQGQFLQLCFEDDRYTVKQSRRVVSGAADFTTPTQLASGYYALGSTIVISGNQWSTYQLCTTAGWLAPAWSGAVTYAKGNKVLSGGEYFVSLQGSNLNHTPPAGTSDAWWEKLTGTTAAVFTAKTL